jgi:GNAT superfamily N-acetyltransferase
MIVRNATVNDLEDACNIDYEAFSLYRTSELPSVIRARWKAFPEGFVVAEIGDIFVGYGSAEKWVKIREPAMNEDPATTHFPQGRIFCITTVAVRKDWRNQGVGRAILARLKEVARRERCLKIILETSHARDFYLKFGFQVAQKREQWDAQLDIMQLCLE